MSSPTVNAERIDKVLGCLRVDAKVSILTEIDRPGPSTDVRKTKEGFVNRFERKESGTHSPFSNGQQSVTIAIRDAESMQVVPHHETSDDLPVISVQDKGLVILYSVGIRCPDKKKNPTEYECFMSLPPATKIVVAIVQLVCHSETNRFYSCPQSTGELNFKTTIKGDPPDILDVCQGETVSLTSPAYGRECKTVCTAGELQSLKENQEMGVELLFVDAPSTEAHVLVSKSTKTENCKSIWKLGQFKQLQKMADIKDADSEWMLNRFSRRDTFQNWLVVYDPAHVDPVAAHPLIRCDWTTQFTVAPRLKANSKSDYEYPLCHVFLRNGEEFNPSLADPRLDPKTTSIQLCGEGISEDAEDAVAKPTHIANNYCEESPYFNGKLVESAFLPMVAPDDIATHEGKQGKVEIISRKIIDLPC